MLPTTAQTAESPPAFWELASLQELYKKRRHILSELESYKTMLAGIEQAIAKQIDIPALYERAGKNSGEITSEIEGLKVKTKVDKRVKWDSDGLFEVARTMPWDRVTELFKLEFSMGEKIYNDLTHKSGGDLEAKRILEGVSSARTVVFGEPKIVSIEEV